MNNRRIKLIKKISVFVIFMCLSSPLFAQFGLGIRGGGNLSSNDGSAFRSSKKIGYQFGIDLIYDFNKNIAIQVEPGYNLTRISNNERFVSDQQGISSGTRSLRYLNVPVYLKLSVTRWLSILGGADFNRLLNDRQYKLNNGNYAFRKNSGIGYSVGIDLGNLYFRYRNTGRNNNIAGNRDSDIQQYQLGFKCRLL